MKHAAVRAKSVAKSNAQPSKTSQKIAAPKSKIAKSDGKTASIAEPKTSLVKAKAVTVKSAPKQAARLAKPAAQKTAPKLSAKTLNALKNISSARRATKLSAPPQKTKAKKTAAESPVRTLKQTERKPKPATNKIAAVEKQAKKSIEPKAKLKIVTTGKKVSTKAVVKTVKSKTPKAAAPVRKSRQTKVAKIVPAKTKPVRQTGKPVAAKTPKAVAKKKPIAAVEPVRQQKIKSAAVEKTVRKSKKVVQKSKETALPTVVKKAVQKSRKIQPPMPAKKAVEKIVETEKGAAAQKLSKPQKLKSVVSAAPPKNRRVRSEKIAPAGKVKTVAAAIETPPVAPKPKNKKARPICSAVFRGKKERYDFKVFALNEKFEPIPAVYIISKRKTDRHKKGHHALICIGETASIADELKRHRKGKCVKKHAANVVSILPETDANVRLKIETDLKAAHSVVCNFE